MVVAADAASRAGNTMSKSWAKGDRVVQPTYGPGTLVEAVAGRAILETALGAMLCGFAMRSLFGSRRRARLRAEGSDRLTYRAFEIDARLGRQGLAELIFEHAGLHLLDETGFEVAELERAEGQPDEAVHGKPEGQPSLPEGGDLAIYVKKNATVNGNAMAVLTFSVQLPNGTIRRAQCPTTVANLINALAVLKGWSDGGHLK